MSLFSPYRLRRRVILHTVDGRSFDGVLTDYRPQFVLRHAALLVAGSEPSKVALDGEVIVEKSNTSFIQVPE